MSIVSIANTIGLSTGSPVGGDILKNKISFYLHEVLSTFKVVNY